jgi:HlyD family secretion protein
VDPLTKECPLWFMFGDQTVLWPNRGVFLSEDSDMVGRLYKVMKKNLTAKCFGSISHKASGPSVFLFLAVWVTGCESDYDKLVSLGTLEQDRIELTADSSEPLTGIFVREGDVVAPGQILLQQDIGRAQVALERAQADVAVTRSALKAAEAGPRQQQISAARARLEAASSVLSTIKVELDRAKSLLDRRLTSQNQVDLLQGRHNEARARVEETTATLDELLEGTRSEDIDQARSRHNVNQAVARNLEITLERASVRAPLDGLIETLPFELGERPTAGATVAVMLALGRTYARIHISEPLRSQLMIGSKALVQLDGNQPPLPGHLSWVSSSAAFTPYYALNQHDRSRLSYLAEIDLDVDDNNLPVGVPVEVTVPSLTE